MSVRGLATKCKSIFDEVIGFASDVTLALVSAAFTIVMLDRFHLCLPQKQAKRQIHNHHEQ